MAPNQHLMAPNQHHFAGLTRVYVGEAFCAAGFLCVPLENLDVIRKIIPNLFVFLSERTGQEGCLTVPQRDQGETVALTHPAERPEQESCLTVPQRDQGETHPVVKPWNPHVTKRPVTRFGRAIEHFSNPEHICGWLGYAGFKGPYVRKACAYYERFFAKPVLMPIAKGILCLDEALASRPLLKRGGGFMHNSVAAPE